MFKTGGPRVDPRWRRDFAVSVVTDSRRNLFLAAVLPFLPMIGWGIAQTFTARIAHPSEWLSAYVQTLQTSTFAVLFLFSAVVNLLIVRCRLPDAPSSYARRYPRYQGTVITLAVGWLVCLAIGPAAALVEALLGAAIAVVSILTFAIIMLPDPIADRIRTRRERERLIRRTPAERQIRRIALFTAVATVLALVVISQVGTLRFTDCEVTGMGEFNGEAALFTTCGDMSIDALPHDALGAGHYDITTQGLLCGFSPRPIVRELRPSAD